MTVSHARADEPSSPPAPAAVPAPSKPAADEGFSHEKQFELSIRLALGLRGIAPYHDEYCGDIDNSASNGFAPVCTGRSPFALDFELGYGVHRRIDLFLELRLGLEQDFGATPQASEGARPFHVSPGARFFFSEAGRAKVFTTAQLVLDFSGYKDPAGEKLGADFGIRNMNGLWFDLDRAYGFYAYVGDTASFARWLRFELEAGIGVQGRYR